MQGTYRGGEERGSIYVIPDLSHDWEGTGQERPT